MVVIFYIIFLSKHSITQNLRFQKKAAQNETYTYCIYALLMWHASRRKAWATEVMLHAGSSLSQTGPGEPSWDAGSVPSNKRVISSPPSSLSSRSLTPRVCLPSNTIISPDGCRSPMSACQGMLQYSWWKLPMHMVMIWKRYTTDLSIGCSFIWMCQSSITSLPNGDCWQKRFSKDSLRTVQFSPSHVWFNERLPEVNKMNWAAPEDALRTDFCIKEVKSP